MNSKRDTIPETVSRSIDKVDTLIVKRSSDDLESSMIKRMETETEKIYTNGTMTFRIEKK